MGCRETMKARGGNLNLASRRLEGSETAALVKWLEWLPLLQCRLFVMAGAMPDYMMPDHRMTVRFERRFIQHLT